jgi:hypothetical protein
MKPRKKRGGLSPWGLSSHKKYNLHVSATHAAIFREVHYKEYIYRNMKEDFGNNTQI